MIEIPQTDTQKLALVGRLLSAARLYSTPFSSNALRYTESARLLAVMSDSFIKRNWKNFQQDIEEASQEIKESK